MKDLTVAAVNFQAEFGQIERNLDKIEGWAERLARQEAQIVCFPELSITGYDHTEAIRPLAQSIPGPATERLVSIAARHGVILLAGLPEIPASGLSSVGGRGRLFISQVIAAPHGVTGLYRKIHVGPSEQELFRRGSSVGVFQERGCTIGLQLCYDAHFPELSTVQALAGAEVLFMAFASPRDNPQAKRDRMLRYLPARAYDNSCYVVSCNLVGNGKNGQTFAGVAMILTPKGEVMAETFGWEENAIVGHLDGQEVERIRQTRMGYFLAHRRPQMYGGLLGHPPNASPIT